MTAPVCSLGEIREWGLTAYDLGSRVAPTTLVVGATPSGPSTLMTPPLRESDLGAAELQVLQTLWEQGPATVREVMNHLHARGRRVAYTTVLTFLSRLEQKGFVTSDKSGLAYVYRPKVSQERISRSRLSDILETFYGGAAGSLVLQLVREEKLSAGEIAELQRLIDQLDAKGRRSRPRR